MFGYTKNLWYIDFLSSCIFKFGLNYIYCHRIFILLKMKFLFLTENTENRILLFLFSDSFEKIILLKIFLKIQSNTFLSIFSILSKNKNRKQLNQISLIDFGFNYSEREKCNLLNVLKYEVNINLWNMYYNS